MNRQFLENVMLGFALALGYFMAVNYINTIFAVGFMEGKKHHVKIRTQREGNIFKYPFRNARRETPPPSNSNSPAESGSAEKEEEKKD